MIDKWLNRLQWFPVIGVAISIYVALIDKPYSIILGDNTTFPFAVYHGVTTAAVWIYYIS